MTNIRPSRLYRPVLRGVFVILGVLLLLLLVNEKNWKPIKGKPTWNVTSNYSDDTTHFAFDRNLDTAWSPPLAMTFGMYVQIDVGAPTTLNGIVLHGKDIREHPVEWLIKTSMDGVHWHTIIPQQHFIYKTMFIVGFTRVQAQYLQIIQTSFRATELPWTIAEIDLLQPVFPWQFARETLVFRILGWLLLILIVLLFLPSQQAWSTRLLPACLILLIVLAGWELRIFDITRYEPALREFYKLTLTDFGRYSQQEWLKQYIQSSKTATSWLCLLLNRWCYQLLAQPLVSLRIVSALFGACSALIVFGLRNMFAPKIPHLKTPFPLAFPDLTESMLGAALVSVSGYSLWLSRHSEFSLALLCCFLVYVAITYRFLYQHGSYGWIPLLLALLCAGFFIEPVMGYLPIGIGIYGGLFLLFSQQRLRRHAWQRYGVYLGSALPLGICWAVFGEKNFLVPSLSKETFVELFRAIALCGLTGWWALIFWAMAGLGILQFIVRRNRAEWFLYLQGVVFSLCIMGFAPDYRPSAFLILTTLLLLLIAKGLWASVTFFLSHKPPRLLGYAVQIAVLGGAIAYFVGFAVNSLFWGSAAWPYEQTFYARYQMEKQIGALLEQLRSDPNECKVMVTPDQEIAELYPELYGIAPYRVTYTDMQRLASLGRFGDYLLLSTTSDYAQSQEMLAFLDAYYTEYGRSARVAVYALRDEFSRLPQRYSWQDLDHTTGHHLEDPRSQSGIVRIATPEDPPGLLVAMFPFRICTKGHHTARFALWSENDDPEHVVAILEVFSDTSEKIARKVLTGKDFPDPAAYHTFDLSFELDLTENPALQKRQALCVVHFPAKTEVRLDYIEFIP